MHFYTASPTAQILKFCFMMMIIIFFLLNTNYYTLSECGWCFPTHTEHFFVTSMKKLRNRSQLLLLREAFLLLLFHLSDFTAKNSESKASKQRRPISAKNLTSLWALHSSHNCLFCSWTCHACSWSHIIKHWLCGL